MAVVLVPGLPHLHDMALGSWQLGQVVLANSVQVAKSDRRSLEDAMMKVSGEICRGVSDCLVNGSSVNAGSPSVADMLKRARCLTSNVLNSATEGAKSMTENSRFILNALPPPNDLSCVHQNESGIRDPTI